MVADYLAAGSLIAARITARVSSIKRVEALGQLYSLLEEEPQAMAQYLSGKLPAAFVGFDGEAIGDTAGDNITHVAEQRWLVVLAVGNYRRADTNQGVVDEAGPILARLVEALTGWVPEGFTELTRQAAPRPGYLAGVGFFPLVFSTDLYIEGTL